MCQYFRVIKSARRRGPRLFNNISQFYSTNEEKLHRNISQRRCFCWLLDTAREIFGVRMCFAHSIFVSVRQTQRKYTDLGCMCRCIICKYGIITFHILISSVRLSCISYIDDRQRLIPLWRSVFTTYAECANSRLTISEFAFTTFIILCNKTTKRLI